MPTGATTGFGKLILAVFCAPIYFFMQGKIGVGVVHSVLYLLALVTLIFGIGVFFWAIGAVHAWWDLAHLKQNEAIEKQATAIAERIAEKRAL